jgi:hypothetical protein
LFDTVAAAEIREHGEHHEQHSQHPVAARLLHGRRRASTTEQHGDAESCTDHGRPHARLGMRLAHAGEGTDDLDWIVLPEVLEVALAGGRERQKTWSCRVETGRSGKKLGKKRYDERGGRWPRRGGGGVGVVMIDLGLANSQ